MNKPPLVAPAIDSHASFAAALRWAFEQSIERRARVITCADPDFADWPLDDSALQSRLTGWLRLPKRRLVLLAADYDEMPRRHARFAAWRVDWSHAIDAFSPPDDLKAELPSVFVDDADLSVELIDAVHWRGRVDIDARSAQLWRERIDVLLQRSEPAFPVNPLGL